MAEPEIKTMKKDIEEMKKKMRISGSLTEPLVKRSEPIPVKPSSPTRLDLPKQTVEQVGEPPKDLPVIYPASPSKRAVGEKILPGTPIPSEPIFSTASAEPIEPPKPLEPAIPLPSRPKEEKPRRKKLFIPAIVLIIILLVGAGFYYWKYLKNPSGNKPEIGAPVSFISTESIELINIKEGKESSLLDRLKKDVKGFQEKDTFRRILIKKIGKEKDYYPSFQETSKMLGINVSNDVIGNLKENYTLFLYAQEDGNRLGIIVQVSNIDNIRNNVKFWEGAMPNDLRPMFLGEELNQPANKDFNDSIYRGVNVRYLNIPNSIFSVDYTIIKDYLVVTTSKESMHKVIDRILEGG